MAVEKLPNPQIPDETLSRLGALMLALRKPGYDVWLDVSVKEGEDPEYEYWETKHRLGVGDFRDGTE